MAAVGGLPDQVEGDADSVVYHHQQLEDPVGGATAVQEEPLQSMILALINTVC